MSTQLLWEGGGWDAALAFGVLAVGAFTLSRGRALPKQALALRVAALFLLLLAAVKPALVVFGSTAEKPKVAILLDASRGMAAGTESKTDYDRARKGVESLRRNLEAFADVHLYVVGARAVRTDWDALEKAAPGGPLDLAQGLEDVWREHGETLAAAWFFSNGVGDRSKDLSAALSRLGCPVYVVGMGRQGAGDGFHAESLKAPEFAFLHLPFPLAVHWSARGLRGLGVRVRVLHDGTELAVARIPVSKEFETGVTTFPVVSPGLGTQEFTVEFTPEGGKYRKETREFALETVRQKLRILYLAGHPSPEYGQLRQYLKANPNFELVSFVILRNPENIVPVPETELSLIPFPAQEIFVTTLNQFDLFLMQDFSYSRFALPAAYMTYVRSFVERGGGLLVMGGDTGFAASGFKGSVLEDLLPIEPEDAAPDWVQGLFTAKPPNPGHPLLDIEGDAKASAKAWAALPPLDGYNRVRRLKPGASALLVNPGVSLPEGGGAMPVLAGRELGRGRVLTLGSPTTWRWRLAAGADEKVAGFYEAFWQRGIQYLTGSLDLNKVRVAPLAESPVAGDPFSLSIHVVDETFSPLSDPNLVLTLKVKGKEVERSYETRETGAGLFSADVPGLPAGSWQVRVEAKVRGRPWGGDTRTILVREASEGERFNRLFLEELARRSKGSYSDFEGFTGNDWLDALPKKKEEKSVRLNVALWASPFVLWTVLVCLLLEWFLRRRQGYW